VHAGILGIHPVIVHTRKTLYMEDVVRILTRQSLGLRGLYGYILDLDTIISVMFRYAEWFVETKADFEM